MRRGEEWALSARDRGPMKRLARDYVDAHRRPSEFYMYALIILVVSLVLGKAHKALNADLEYLLLAIIAIIIVDAILLRRSISRLAKERLPGESTRGITFYAIMRALQLRRFRNPSPRLKPGDSF
jgi:predicted lysophospholipase L1 biosynthesis ABC-type transport system permease subunit